LQPLELTQILLQGVFAYDRLTLGLDDEEELINAIKQEYIGSIRIVGDLGSRLL